MQITRGPFRHHVGHVDPQDPSYQPHLIHEDFSLESQRLLDDRVPEPPSFRFVPEQRREIDQVLAGYTLLNARHQVFLEAHANPPVVELIDLV